MKTAQSDRDHLWHVPKGTVDAVYFADSRVVRDVKVHIRAAHDLLIVAMTGDFPRAVGLFHYDTDIIQNVVDDALAALLNVPMLALILVANLASTGLER